jgi:hypothetical protein
MESNEYISQGNSEVAEGAGFGATGGTVVGGLTGLLVGLGALVIPGIGPVVAAGSLAAALSSAAIGAGIGAAAGGLLGALVGAGIPEEDAHLYSEGIRRGGALVMAQVDDRLVDTALDIMERHNVVDIDERGNTYREAGWSRFDQGANVSASSAGVRTGDTRSTTGHDEYAESSNVGAAAGTLAGAAAGAALGSVGGPVGTVVGGIAGAVTGGGIGAAGDAIGQEATDTDAGRTSGYSGTSASSGLGTTRRSRSYEIGGTSAGLAGERLGNQSSGAIDPTAARIEKATEHGLDADLNQDGDVGASDRRNNY